jgi:hypothetical protein
LAWKFLVFSDECQLLCSDPIQMPRNFSRNSWHLSFLSQ